MKDQMQNPTKAEVDVVSFNILPFPSLPNDIQM